MCVHVVNACEGREGGGGCVTQGLGCVSVYTSWWVCEWRVQLVFAVF